MNDYIQSARAPVLRRAPFETHVAVVAGRAALLLLAVVVRYFFFVFVFVFKCVN